SDGQRVRTVGIVLAPAGDCALTDADLRSRVGRAIRRTFQHVRGSRQGTAPQTGRTWPASDPNTPGSGLRPRSGNERRGSAMKLVTRVSAFFLAALAIALIGYSAVIYYLISSYLYRQFDANLHGALDLLAASVEVEQDDAKWQPGEHGIDLSQPV